MYFFQLILDEVDASSDSSPILKPAGVILPSNLKCVGVLPGLGSYPDSSDSDGSSESDCEFPLPSPYDLLGRTAEHFKPAKQQQPQTQWMIICTDRLLKFRDHLSCFFKDSLIFQFMNSMEYWAYLYPPMHSDYF